MMSPCLWRLLDINTMQINGDCLSAHQESLKAVLLHNGNELPSIPLAHATNMKETYENMVFPLDRIRYKKYNWLFRYYLV